MKVLIRTIKWALLVLLVLLVGGIIAIQFIEFRQSDEEIAREFATGSVKPVIQRYKIGDRTIRFIETPPNDSLPVVIFVHGAPSSLSFFNKFFKDKALLQRARLVSVDRPGYGYSDFGRVETSVSKQAELLQPLIDRYKKAPFLMLVGSSYGGPVVARLAMNNPMKADGSGVDHVVFISSALGPGLERIYNISYWIDSPLLRWGVPPLLKLANDEKLAHQDALKEILPDWHKITAGITILHGQRDDLVYPTNVEFAQNQLVNAPVKQFILPENRHDIVFNKREYVTNILLNILLRGDVKEKVKQGTMVNSDQEKDMDMTQSGGQAAGQRSSVIYQFVQNVYMSFQLP